MAFTKSAVILMMMMALCGFSMAAVYKVGDSAGWTSRGQVDYHTWAANKDFRVGDTIVFEYNNQFHNVKQVTHQDFQSCNTTFPIAAYTTGSDSITLKRPGHYYYLCGFPSHCQAGQKVDILVTPFFLRSSPAPSASSPQGTPSVIMEPSPAKNSAPSLYSSKLWSALVVLASFITVFAY